MDTTRGVDLSDLRAGYESLSEDEKRAVRDMGQKAPDEPLPVRTALMVFLNHEGAWQVSADLTLPLAPDRPPTPDEVYSAAAIMQKDILAQETAMHTQSLMMQVGRMVQEQAQAAQMRQNLGNLRV